MTAAPGDPRRPPSLVLRRSLKTALGLTLLIGLGAGVWLSFDRSQKSQKSPTTIVAVVPGAGAASPAPEATPTGDSDADQGDAATIARIEATVDVAGATFRAVRQVDQGRAACGEISRAGGGSFGRFVWLEGQQLLAVDDGSADFAHVAEVCAGRSLRDLAAEAERR